MTHRDFIALTLTLYYIILFYIPSSLKKENQRTFFRPVFQTFLFLTLFGTISFLSKELSKAIIIGFLLGILLAWILFAVEKMARPLVKFWVLLATIAISLPILAYSFQFFFIFPTDSTTTLDIYPLLLISILVMKPGNMLVSSFIDAYLPKLRLLFDEFTAKEKIEMDWVQKTGPVVGVLERLFSIVLLYADQWAGFAFIIAAKEFSHSTKAKDLKGLSEYQFIGTLFSLLYAILIYKVVFSLLN